MLEVLTAAIALAANPFALAGYIGLGVYSQTLWQAIKYGVLWGAAVQIFAVALGRAALTEPAAIAVQTGLRLLGALIITVGVFYLYRLIRGGGGGGGRSNGTKRPPSRLRRVK